MSVQFIGWEKVGSGLYGAGHAYFAAPASAVAIDRGCGSEYYFGRRMYVSVGPFSKGVADSSQSPISGQVRRTVPSATLAPPAFPGWKR